MSLIFQSEHIASSIVYTLWERTFTVSLSLEKGRTYFFFWFFAVGFHGGFCMCDSMEWTSRGTQGISYV